MAAVQGDPPVWDDFLAGYAAGVDTPFSSCWRNLAAAYPDAPVLLSHRGSAEAWHRSMDVTVLARTRDMLAIDDGADRWCRCSGLCSTASSPTLTSPPT